ncbi:N-6 DNA methylase [Bacteroidota bacterium]
MTLKETILKVLIDIAKPASPILIAKEINKQSLLKRSNGKPITGGDVREAVQNSPELFFIQEGNVYVMQSNEDKLKRNFEIFKSRISDDDYGDMGKMFEKMADLSWEENFSGRVELHIATLFFYSILNQIPNPLIKKIEFKSLSHIFSLVDKEKVSAYIKELQLLNNTEPLKGIFDLILGEQDRIIESEQYYLKLFYLLEFHEINIWKDSDLPSWLERFLYVFGFSNKDASFAITPWQVTMIIKSIIPRNNYKNIFDPAAGYGSMLVESIDSETPVRAEQIYCQEINSIVATLLRMNLIAHGYNPFISTENSIKESIIEDQSADLVLCDLPKGSRTQIDQRLRTDQKISYVNTDDGLVDIIINKMNSTGRAIINVGYGFLFRTGRSINIKRELIENDMIEAVISLPPGYYKPYSGIGTCVLVLNKNKLISKKEKILFVDFAEKATDNRDVIIGDIEKLRSVLHTWQDIAEYSKVIETSEIIAHNFNLTPSLHLDFYLEVPLRTGEHLIELGNLLKQSKTESYVFKKTRDYNEFPFIKVSNLSINPEDFYLDTSNTDITGGKYKRGTLLKESALLISRVGEKLKPQYFKFDNDPIVLNPNILAFTIDQDIVDIEYLIFELRSKYFAEQLNKIRRFSGIPNFNRKDFLNLKIRVPSRPDQSIRVSEYKEIFYEGKKREIDLVQQKLFGQQYRFDIVSTIKHNMSGKIGTIINDLDYLLLEIDTSKKKSSSDQSEKPLRTDFVVDVLRRIIGTAKDASKTLMNTEDYLLASKKNVSLEPINIYRFIKENIIPRYSRNQRFSIIIDQNSKKLEKRLIINGSEFLLVEAFTNLIDNAIQHGFIDNKKKYEILFELTISEDRKELLVGYKNDGVPLPSNMNKSSYLRFGGKSGENSGDGIGGATIGVVLERLEANMIILNDSDLQLSKYNVAFDFIFPLLIEE